MINYTCAVYWREERLMDYNNRWNLHYAIDNLSRSSSVHWLSLLNSLMLVGVLSLVAATFVYQLVRADHRISAKEEAPETDHRWRLLAADAIQQPSTVGVLSTLAAYGVWSLVATLDVLLTLFLNNELHFGLAISASAFFNNHQGSIFMCSLVVLLGSGFASAFVGVVMHKLLANEPPLFAFRVPRLAHAPLPVHVQRRIIYHAFGRHGGHQLRDVGQRVVECGSVRDLCSYRGVFRRGGDSDMSFGRHHGQRRGVLAALVSYDVVHAAAQFFSTPSPEFTASSVSPKTAWLSPKKARFCPEAHSSSPPRALSCSACILASYPLVSSTSIYSSFSTPSGSREQPSKCTASSSRPCS